jgi:hypothetical protein
MTGHSRRAVLFAAVATLVLTATGCVGTVSVGMAVPGPYMGPYGGSVYVGATVPVGW